MISVTCDNAASLFCVYVTWPGPDHFDPKRTRWRKSLRMYTKRSPEATTTLLAKRCGTRLPFNRTQTTCECVYLLALELSLFARVTLILTRWPWCMNVTQIFWSCTCISREVSMSRLSKIRAWTGQTDTETGATKCITMPHLRVVNT